MLAQRQRHVLEDRHRIEQRAALEQHPDARPRAEELALGEPRHVLAGHVDAAALGPREAADQAQHRGLARAAAAEHHGDLGAHEAAGEAVEDAPLPAPQMDAVEPDPEVVRGPAVHALLPPRRSHRHASAAF